MFLTSRSNFPQGMVTNNASSDMRSDKKQTLLFRKSGVTKNHSLAGKVQASNSFKTTAMLHSSSRGLPKDYATT